MSSVFREPTTIDAATSALDGRIAALIDDQASDPGALDLLALDLFAYQFERNAPYHRYCERLGRTPGAARSIADIPAIPTSAFANARIACFPPSATKLAFISSGTTSGGKASVHELDTPALYERSLLAHYRACVLPDRARMRLIALAPPFEEAQESSLSYMLSSLSARASEPGGGFFVRGDAIDVEGLERVLSAGAGPAVVFGTAFAFVHFFDRCRAQGRRFAMAAGSRVVETGGFKGKSRAVARDELYAQFETLLGVPRDHCLSEYGMCELGSQWYDANVADVFAGRTPRRDVKIGPHWARVTIVDPVTTEPLARGETGLIQIFDASNRGSVSAILTADLGREVDGGFEMLGRSRSAPPKGCSIALDAMLDAANG